jgi:hypothetical protein
MPYGTNNHSLPGRKIFMKTTKFVFPLAALTMILAVVLVACGAKTNAAATSRNAGAYGTDGTPVARNFNQPLPLAEQLLIGTIKLQETGNAVDAKTAAELIPLWQAYAQLTSSNTAAQAEIDAVVTQIQDTMTTQRIQAITDMKLTRQDMLKTMSDLGLSNGFGRNGTGTPRAPGSGGDGGFIISGNDAGGPPRGGAPGGGGIIIAGGPPRDAGEAGGGFEPGGGAGTGGSRSTPNATQQALQAQFANRIPAPLMNALISLLQKTAGV